MKALLPLTLIATLMAGGAFAACTAPTNTATIPNGSKATKDEMLTAQRAVKAYDAAVKTFTDCLKTDQDAEIAAAGDTLTQEARDKISSRYAQRGNNEVDKAEKLAAKFNAELKAYKAKNPA